jgi:hypothetical protein
MGEPLGLRFPPGHNILYQDVAGQGISTLSSYRLIPGGGYGSIAAGRASAARRTKTIDAVGVC